MTKRTILRLHLTIERIEVSTPSSSPFRAARRVVDTEATELRDTESRPGIVNARQARVLQFRKVG